MPLPRFDAVIFDLDGTLLDSVADIADAGNHAMAAVGRPTFPVDRYNTLAGQGLPFLIEHALGPDHQHLFDPAIAAHRAYYAKHSGTHTRPFPGIADMLDNLTQHGLKLAVLSNKPHNHTGPDVHHHFGTKRFAQVYGHRDGYKPKPDPASAMELTGALGTTPDRVAYVGDTAADMQTGKAAGFFTIGVTWGFRDREELQAHGADAIIDSPDALLPCLTKARA